MKSFKKTRNSLLAAVLILAVSNMGSVITSADSSEPAAVSETTAEQNASQSQKPEVILPVIGVKDEGDTVASLILKNGTDLDFKEVSVKYELQDTWPANMMPEGEVFAAREKRVLYYDTEEAVKAQELYEQREDAAPDTPAQKPSYLVRLIDTDDNEYILHAFPFGDIEKGSVCFTEDVLWLRYRSLETGELVKTLEAEKANAELNTTTDTADVYEESSYYEEPYEEEYYYEEPYEEEYYYEEYYYEEPYYEEPYYEEPVYEEPYYEEPAPEEYYDPNQGCLGDDALTWG